MTIDPTSEEMPKSAKTRLSWIQLSGPRTCSVSPRLGGLAVVETNDQRDLIGPGVDETEVGPEPGILGESDEPDRLPIHRHRGFAGRGDPLAIAAPVADGRGPGGGDQVRRWPSSRSAPAPRPPRRSPTMSSMVRASPGSSSWLRVAGGEPEPGRSSTPAVTGWSPALINCALDVQKLPSAPAVWAAAETSRVDRSETGRHDGQSTVIRRSPFSSSSVVPTIRRMVAPAVRSRESQESVSRPRQWLSRSSSWQAPAIACRGPQAGPVQAERTVSGTDPQVLKV